MIIKVCGMRDPENIRQMDEQPGIDWLGFIFYSPSSRFVEEVPTYLPQHKKRVGVFVNESLPNILNHTKTYGLDFIQLHGKETSIFCKHLRTLLSAHTKLIKTIPISSAEDLARTAAFKGVVDYFLFETKCDTYGGSGKQFDWSILQNYHGTTPFLLTGGIKPSDAEKVKAFHHPQFIGIDLNSGFETAPALKDPALLHDFLEIVKSSNFLK